MIKSSGTIHDTVFIAETASVVGDVTIGRGSSVWYATVLRGDMREIKIGEYTNPSFEKYIEELTSMIRYNKLTKYDK